MLIFFVYEHNINNTYTSRLQDLRILCQKVFLIYRPNSYLKKKKLHFIKNILFSMFKINKHWTMNSFAYTSLKITNIIVIKKV